MVDGAPRFQTLLRIVLPSAIPGVVTAGIFAFTLSWNEFIYSLVLVSSDDIRTIVDLTPHSLPTEGRKRIGCIGGDGSAPASGENMCDGKTRCADRAIPFPCRERAGEGRKAGKDGA